MKSDWSKFLSVVCSLAGWVVAAHAGTVITANLPDNTAIVNIDARQDGAANAINNYAIWYHPFGTGGSLLRHTVAPGTYAFRVVNPADAAAQFPALTGDQTRQIFTAWTYNTPWITDYLVFEDAAATDYSRAQLFDGSPDPQGFNNATDAYASAVANGYATKIRPDPAGRAGSYFTEEYTFQQATTLIFVVPDYGLGDNQGGVSVLVSPARSILTVPWFTVDGGGATSSDGILTLAGTIGQPDAGTMSDSVLTVQGGFWAGIPVPPPPPILPPTNVNFVVLYSRTGSPDGTVWQTSGDGAMDSQIAQGEWPRVSPDCQWLLLRRGNATYSRSGVFARNLITGQEQLVFQPSDHVVGVDWAPDSFGLRYDLGCGLYRVNRDGSGSGTLANASCYDDAPVVNPVDGRIAYQCIQSGLMLAQPDGTGRQIIPGTQPNDVWPAWSRDGQTLVFLRGTSFHTIRLGAPTSINLLANLTGVRAANGVGTGLEGAAAFTPDGRWVIAPLNFQGEVGLYAVAADGSGGCWKLPISAGAPPNWVGSVVSKQSYTSRADLEVTLTPTSIRASAGERATLHVNVHNLGPSDVTSVLATLTLPNGIEAVTAQSASGSVALLGQAVTVAFDSISAGDTAVLELLVLLTQPGINTMTAVATCGTPDLNRTNNSAGITFVAKDPGGDQLTRYSVLYNRAGSPDGTVWLARADGTADTQITTGEYPRLSPDGQWMIVRRGNANWFYATVYVRNVQDGTEHAVITPSDWLIGVDWAPDSFGLRFDMSCGMLADNRDGNGRWGLFYVDCYDDAPAVQPRDGRIVFHNTRSGLYRATLDGYGRTRIPNTTGADVFPAWSGDGEWIAFYSGSELDKIHPDGSGRTNLLANFAAALPQGTGCAFSPDGLWVFTALSLGGSTNLYAVAADGSGQHVMISLAPGAIPNFVGSVTMVEPDPTPPALTIVGTLDGRVRLSWAAAAMGWTLESSDRLEPGAWKTSTLTPVVGSGEWTVTKPSSMGSEYFRLRK